MKEAGFFHAEERKSSVLPAGEKRRKSCFMQKNVKAEGRFYEKMEEFHRCKSGCVDFVDD